MNSCAGIFERGTQKKVAKYSRRKNTEKEQDDEGRENECKLKPSNKGPGRKSIHAKDHLR